ncbi:hypothetical protein DSM104443_04017 [Usitatibacter rugosus]|uniref:Uncharacterized protein n=1 Tax=Usitatibacter rugosus TaxID=2732067 RepID=A0A6M4H2I7_9PROT|nr:hypothetical protein [Usitatibacter rugosus]QJR12923.1 hypothetical protein DSM104443_04017 [Usitatibacter rugosus]
MKTALASFLVAAITALAPALAAEPQMTRPQALKRLADSDAGKRREAIARLGDVGVMADAKALVDELRDPDEQARTHAEEALWKIWARSGDAKVDALYAKGMAQMSAGDGEGAVETFTRIIKMKPAFAEAWNKRATVYFLMEEYEKSLADCDEVMKRNPYHFGALSGYFQIYLEMEEYERAIRYGRRALAINPNLEGLKNSVEALERQIGKSEQVV